jgi:hypothetical protein
MTVRMTEKIAVFAPIPRASVRMARPGVFTSGLSRDGQRADPVGAELGFEVSSSCFKRRRVPLHQLEEHHTLISTGTLAGDASSKTWKQLK